MNIKMLSRERSCQQTLMPMQRKGMCLMKTAVKRKRKKRSNLMEM